MLKFKLLVGRPDRLAKVLDTEKYDIETSRMDDEVSTAELPEIADDSPTDEMEVIPAIKDD